MDLAIGPNRVYEDDSFGAECSRHPNSASRIGHTESALDRSEGQRSLHVWREARTGNCAREYPCVSAEALRASVVPSRAPAPSREPLTAARTIALRPPACRRRATALQTRRLPASDPISGQRPIAFAQSRPSRLLAFPRDCFHPSAVSCSAIASATFRSRGPGSRAARSRSRLRNARGRLFHRRWTSRGDRWGALPVERLHIAAVKRAAHRYGAAISVCRSLPYPGCGGDAAARGRPLRSGLRTVTFAGCSMAGGSRDARGSASRSGLFG